VERYLQELTALLQGIDPVERAEVVEGVREHIDSSLAGGDRTEDRVRAVLSELGPAATVAEEAHADRPASGVLLRSAMRPPLTSRAWVPPVVAGFEAFTQLVVALVVGSSGVVSGGSASVTTSTGRTTMVQPTSSFDWSPFGVVASVFAAFPFWLVVVVLVAASALWTAREKVVLMTLPLAAIVTLTILPLAGYALVGVTGVYIGAWTAIALLVIGGGSLTWVLTRRASRRSAALTT
jgi:hypothetical protein